MAAVGTRAGKMVSAIVASLNEQEYINASALHEDVEAVETVLNVLEQMGYIEASQRAENGKPSNARLTPDGVNFRTTIR